MKNSKKIKSVANLLVWAVAGLFAMGAYAEKSLEEQILEEPAAGKTHRKPKVYKKAKKTRHPGHKEQQRTEVATPRSEVTEKPTPESNSTGIEPKMVQLRHKPKMVQLPSGIWMSKYEVTQAEWRSVMGSNPSNFSSCGDNCPVEDVSWDDVQGFITKLNAKTGKIYRLPTEEEWFTACQAGSSTEYCGSDNIDTVAWYENNSGKTTHLVGKKTANAWGLHDMSGNVWEWTSSCYEGNCEHRVLRGGSWDKDSQDLRSANREKDDTDDASKDVGFRIVRDL